MNDIIGHTELMETKPSVLDFSRLLNKEEGTLHFTGDIHQPAVPLGMQGTIIDEQMIAASENAIGLHHQEYKPRRRYDAVGSHCQEIRCPGTA